MVNERLREHALLFDCEDHLPEERSILMESDSEHNILDVPFVDDAMIPLILDNDVVIRSLREAMDIMHESFIVHFMEPNYGKGDDWGACATAW
eukprot:6109305-Pyramimonas_sp.AAC.1